MNIVEKISKELAEQWLPYIYEQKIRIQRTRSHHFDIEEKGHEALIMHTLLGIELKVGSARFSCPDLSTARYVRVFARIGCRDFAIPYDITRISEAADMLEASWQRILLVLDRETDGKPPQTIGRMRSMLLNGMRSEISLIGAGEKMPDFRTETRFKRK